MRKAVCMACCAAIMLCGCGGGSDPDIAKDHKDFWEYSFGGSLTIKKNAKKCNDEENVWDVSFTDKKGVKQESELSLDIEQDKDYAKYESDWTTLNFVVSQINLALNDELYENLLKDAFSCERSEEDPFQYNGDGFTLRVVTECCDLIDPSEELLKADLDAQSGFSYVDTDLKSWAQQKYNGLQMYVILEDAADVEAVSQMMLKFGGDYGDYTVNPQNYCFTIHAPDADGNLQLSAGGCKVMGELAEPSDYSMSYLLQKLGRSGYAIVTDVEDAM